MQEMEKPTPYKHWMLREIHEQPLTLAATLERYVAGVAFVAETTAPIREWLQATKNEIVIAASGSSRHAGMVAELLLEDLSGIGVDVEYASEYTYRSEKALKNASVLVVSQSGETADTLAALRKAKLAGHATLAITNVATSTMAREASASFPTEAGRERAIPATKSFTAQLLDIYLLALLAAEERQTMDVVGACGFACVVEEPACGMGGQCCRSCDQVSQCHELSVSWTRDTLSDCPRGSVEVEGVGLSSRGGISERRTEARPERAGERGNAAGDDGDSRS
jgi:hypothetical protein